MKEMHSEALSKQGLMPKLTQQSQTQSKRQPYNNPNALDRQEVVWRQFKIVCGG